MKNRHVHGSGISVPRLTAQESYWSVGGRNHDTGALRTPAEIDSIYMTRFGIMPTRDFPRMLISVGLGDPILEIGCGRGNMLEVLRSEGWTNLHGVEIDAAVVEEVKTARPWLDVRQGRAREVPFEGRTFAAVLTSGLLIHVAPENLGGVIDEMGWMLRPGGVIVGLEYWSEGFAVRKMEETIPLVWTGPYREAILARLAGSVTADSFRAGSTALAVEVYAVRLS